MHPRVRPRVERLEDRSLLSATTTTLTVSPNPVTVGQSVTLTATITGGDFTAGSDLFVTDPVMFMDGATPLTSVTPHSTGGPNHESRAQFTTTSLAIGSHNLVAKYGGGFDPIMLLFNDASTSATVVEGVNAPLPPTPPTPLDVSALVSVTSPRHKHNALRQTINLHNSSGTAITGPVFLLLGGLNPKVRLKNAVGTAQRNGHAGEPFLEDNVSLNPGGDLSLMLVFGNPRHKPIRFRTTVLAGPGAI
jgi:hypothetical protein